VVDVGVRLNDDVWEMDEKLDDTDRENLDRPFTEEEIHEVIAQMEKNIKLLALMEFLCNFINIAGISSSSKFLECSMISMTTELIWKE
jgi:hypothetical protein